MKKVIFILLPLILLALFLYLKLNSRSDGQEVSQVITNTPDFMITEESDVSPNVTQIPGIDIEGFKVVWLIVRDFGKIDLKSNLETKLTSTEAFINDKCKYLVNAGFFGEDGKHIGLFVENGDVISSSEQNNLFNGFLAVDNSTAVISDDVPLNPKNAVQSGPLLYMSGKPIQLNINSQEPARRIVSAVSERKEIIYLAFYLPSNNLSGPTLGALPGLLEKLDEATSLKIKDAINLDGGSHSVFLGSNIRLTEASKIGSYFCIR